MDKLSMDNILSPYDIDNLFADITTRDDDGKETPKDDNPEGTKKEEKEEKSTENHVTPEELFKSESVGSEDNKGKEDTTPAKEGPSPIYSSIAQAFAEDGVFPDLSEDDYKDISDAASFRALIDKQIAAGLDERQKRIEAALNAGIKPDEVTQLENANNVLNSIKEDAIRAEDEAGDNLRRNLIYQSFVNRGFNDEKARKMVDKSFAAGTDVEDALDALEDNKAFYQDRYKSILDKAKAAQEEKEKESKRLAENLRKSILEDDKVFGGVEIDKKTRQLVYDNMIKPVYKGTNDGQYLTAIQKYQQDHPEEFFKNVGLLYTLTDGFKSIDKLVKGKVKKEVNKGISRLESLINGSSRDLDGNLNFAGSKEDDSIFRGYSLDLS